MGICFFVSDLHGRLDRYRKLFDALARERPQAVFLGGDLLPSGGRSLWTHAADFDDFLQDFVQASLRQLQAFLGPAYPRVFAILGNDDPRAAEPALTVGEVAGVWEHVHARHVTLGGFDVYGYACVPPTPFRLKDWERYDVSRFVEPGCLAPEEGLHTVLVPEHELQCGTIQADLDELTGVHALTRAIFLFHSPPYQTKLDRAALDGRSVDHAPLDVHVGSVAIRRCIGAGRPRMTRHGHGHESARLTGAWQDRIGDTYCFSAAHDGPELALVRFDPADPARATRTLL